MLEWLQRSELLCSRVLQTGARRIRRHSVSQKLIDQLSEMSGCKEEVRLSSGGDEWKVEGSVWKRAKSRRV